MLKNAALINLFTILLLALEGSVNGASRQVSHGRARSIMGKNFLGAEAVSQHFRIELTKEEANEVRDIPFSERTLRECRESHLLVLGVSRDNDGRPLTIERLRQIFPLGGQPCFRSYPGPAHSREPYAIEETPERRWYLIAKRLVEKSRSKPYWQQEQFLGKKEYRERAVVYVYTMLLLFKARGERLFEKDLVLSRDVGSDGAPVAAGYFGRDGVYVSDWWLRPDFHFGIAPARKPDVP